MAKQFNLTRGNVAKKFGINPETIRYYEAQKLIKKSSRLHNNYRVYDQDDVMRIHFILKAKKLALSLKEIKMLLNFSATQKSDREKVRSIIQEKSKLITEKVKQLRAMQKALNKLYVSCKHDKRSPECPILKSLTNL